MTGKLEEIEKQASRLSAAERERLASRLFESVHHKELNEIDQAWIAVAEERVQAFQSGHDKGIEEEAFFSQVRAELEW